MCKKGNNKINALCRIRKWITIEKARILNNAYILSLFFYCPIVWMFYSKTSNNLIDKTHKRALRVVYNSYDKSLEELLQIDGGVTIHQRNLRTLLIEVYKSINKLNPEFMWNIFHIKDISYLLRKNTNLILPQTNTKTYGTNAVLFKTCYIWNNFPNHIKTASNLSEFKYKIKAIQNIQCCCKICK